MSVEPETSFSRCMRARPYNTTRARRARRAVAPILSALVVASGTIAGCVVGEGLDSQSGQPGGAAASNPSEASAAYNAGDALVHEPGDARLAPDTSSTDASSDANRDAPADADAEATVDAGAGEAADAGDDGAADASADRPSWDAPSETGADAASDADLDADMIAPVEAAFDARTDAGADAGSDAGCNAPPHLMILTPASGATISVTNGDPSTYVFTFSAHVDFCVPMQSVTFDYAGPTGLVQQQEMIFNSYAVTFAQNTRVGGPGNSLAAHNGGQNPSDWTFYVTATDANKQTAVGQETFTLVVRD